MTRLASKCGLADIIFNECGRDIVNAYSDWEERSNYILADTYVAKYIEIAWNVQFKTRHKGDHQSISIDLDVEKSFGNPMHVIVISITRD